MKKIFITAVGLLMIVSTISNAQDTKKFRFGLQGSPSLAWLKPDTKNIQNNGFKLNASYGFIIDYKFADNFSFATGFGVCYTGGKLQISYDSLQQDVLVGGVSTKMTFKGVNASNLYKLQYLELPILLKMTTNEIGYFTYFANIGAGMGFRLKAKGDYNYKYLNGIDEPLLKKENDDIKDDISFIRPSFIIGGGAEYSLGGSTKLIASINFNNGLTDILTDKNNKAINNFVSLNIGILF
ncbi:MAG: porin family protein [Bacteroidota bacterium]